MEKLFPTQPIAALKTMLVLLEFLEVSLSSLPLPLSLILIIFLIRNYGAYTSDKCRMFWVQWCCGYWWSWWCFSLHLLCMSLSLSPSLSLSSILSLSLSFSLLYSLSFSVPLPLLFFKSGWWRPNSLEYIHSRSWDLHQHLCSWCQWMFLWYHFCYYFSTRSYLFHLFIILFIFILICLFNCLFILWCNC